MNEQIHKSGRSDYYVSNTNPSGESLRCFSDSPHARHEWKEYPQSDFFVMCPGMQDNTKRKSKAKIKEPA